ncbi:MAG: inositol monophosphatase [bacterium]
MTATAEIEDRLRLARLWARQGGRMALGAFESIESEWKNDGGELVTEADRTIEKELRSKIRNRFPEDAVVGEEFETLSGQNHFRWYLDPIDGTAAYSMNLPIWCVSIGLFHRGSPVAGVLRAPFMDEEFYGSKLEGPYKDGHKLKADPDLPADWTSESLLCVTSNAHRAYSIDFPGKCRSLGSSAYYLGLVADGRAVGAHVGRLHLWDIAGGLGLTSGYSTRFVTLAGRSPNWDRLRQGKCSEDPILFTHESLVEPLTERIRER